jgi:hypothetical protein
MVVDVVSARIRFPETEYDWLEPLVRVSARRLIEDANGSQTRGGPERHRPFMKLRG